MSSSLFEANILLEEEISNYNFLKKQVELYENELILNNKLNTFLKQINLNLINFLNNNNNNNKIQSNDQNFLIINNNFEKINISNINYKLKKTYLLNLLNSNKQLINHLD